MPPIPTLLPPPPTLHPADGWSLFLDFDGTLVPIAHRHDAVVVADGLPALLARAIETLGGRLAVVSGRPARDIDSFLANGTASFAIAGSHGVELAWPDGRREAPPRADRLDTAIAALDRFAAKHSGIVIERKPFGAAVHYRLAPDTGEQAIALAESVAAKNGLVVQHGKMVAELRIGGADKGDAVRRFMAAPPMAGTRPVFVGDDLTDEAGFEAVDALGGWGVLVGDGRATAARYRLAGPAEVQAWLRSVAGMAA